MTERDTPPTVTDLIRHWLAGDARSAEGLREDLRIYGVGGMKHEALDQLNHDDYPDGLKEAIFTAGDTKTIDWWAIADDLRA